MVAMYNSTAIHLLMGALRSAQKASYKTYYLYS